MATDPFKDFEKTYKIFDCTECNDVPTVGPPTTKTSETGEETITASDDPKPTGGEGAKQGGLSTGGIVGIVIALLICLVLLILLILILLRRRKEKSEEPDEGEMTEETIDDTASSLGTYTTANAEITEDNPLFTQQLSFPESQDHKFEESWM